MERKIVFVTYGKGRTGSSALNGLLNVGGFCTGKNYRDSRNPKGFHEDNAWEHLMRSTFGEKYYPTLSPPTLDSYNEIRTLAIENIETISSYFNAALGRNNLVSRKSPSFLAFHFADLLRVRTQAQVYFLVLSRQPNTHLESLRRMWKGVTASDIPDQEILRILENWKEYGTKLIEYSKASALSVPFEDLTNHTNLTATKVFDHIEVEKPESSKIERWIDPKLVARKHIHTNKIMNLLYRVRNRLGV